MLEAETNKAAMVATSSNNPTVVISNKATDKVMVSSSTIKEVTGNKATKPKEMLMDNNKVLNILPMVVEPLLLKQLQPLYPTGKVLQLQTDRFTITINEQERLNGTSQWGCRKVFVSAFLLAATFVFLFVD